MARSTSDQRTILIFGVVCVNAKFGVVCVDEPFGPERTVSVLPRNDSPTPFMSCAHAPTLHH